MSFITILSSFFLLFISNVSWIDHKIGYKNKIRFTTERMMQNYNKILVLSVWLPAVQSPRLIYKY